MEIGTAITVGHTHTRTHAHTHAKLTYVAYVYFHWTVNICNTHDVW